MRELKDIAARASVLRQRREPFTVATVVRVEGSAYRREGARMLVERDGQATGAVSGGCLEGEVIHQTREALASGEPLLVSYRLGHGDPMLDAVLGFGSGCDGTVWLLIEPVLPGADVPLGPLAATAALDSRHTGSLATVFASEDPALVGRRRLALDGEAPRSTLSPSLDARVASALASGARGPHRPAVLHLDGADVLVEPVRPPIRLAVFGHGPDAVPLVRAAYALGWATTLVGTRPPEELAARFPEADERRVLTHAEEVQEHIEIDARTAAVVLTHVYLRDRVLLRGLLASGAFYVGALGSRGRAARLRADLADAGVTPEAIARLRAPVGLDLGAETPEEIAVAIVAEVLAADRGRYARPLAQTAVTAPEAASCST
ncbi:XdhC family protein [Rubricoccus marinus]|uniref:Xanthine dehydrogenase n=1 Tax=Rubricoccus marinus TaxID=716817 RepID=A0A259TX02_9BACT|nr:XdhC/CoxI family protein [Rubricoccus marinus]OZC02078.1 hypothetical protein BSZ36_03210 [Rubricoccus marinus]